MIAMPRTMNSSATSVITTSRPAWAATWAMPAPIWPAPATSTLRTLTDASFERSPTSLCKQR